MARYWQEHDKIMASSIMAITWQYYDNNMARHGNIRPRTWQEHGNHMARTWQEHGKKMTRASQEHGKSMAATWQEHDTSMAIITWQ
jgi:hypothetical protein